MIDYGTRQTDLAVRRAEWRLSRVYRQAQRDIEDKMKAWQEGHAKREERYKQQLAEGKITQADFDAWMRGQVFQDKQWQARKAEIDRILLNADREAQRIVNEGKIGVFADNANYIGYDLERNGNVNTGFTLYDQNTVGRLIKSDPQILPKPAPGVQKDKAYTYYNKLMNSAITQGIVQGETIPQIAKRIVDVTGERSYSSAVRNARTAYTGAQNAGRMEGLHQAQRLGINVKKKWMATLDSRTRDAHADLDGQIQEVDDPFESELGDIMYPGDPTAHPGNVYNCRCTLVYVYPEYPSEMQRRTGDGEIVGDMTYREWEEMKQGEKVQEPGSTQAEQAEQTQKTVDYFDMETTREISVAMGEAIGRPVDLQGMDKTLAARTARLYTDLVNEYGIRASSIGMNNKRAAFGQVNHKYTGEKKLTFSKSLFESPDKLREVLMGEQRKGQTIPIRGGVILDYVQTHEFAHLFGSSLEDGYYNANQPFWREIGAVMRKYIDDRSRPLGKYAAQNIDEFMAEAFADGYLNRQPTEYGQLVKAIVDKYFKKRR